MHRPGAADPALLAARRCGPSRELPATEPACRVGGIVSMLIRTFGHYAVLALVGLFLAVVDVTAESKPAAKPVLQAEAPAAPLQALDVYPHDIQLTGPRALHRVVVLGRYADGRQWDLTREAKLTSAAPAVARVEGSVIYPVGDGTAEVRVEAGGQTATVKVTVTHASAETPVSFTREVNPLLTKLGCNQGACHGAQHGRGGFKLSLFGFDPEFDHTQIVKSAEGRRVVLADPERSILLSKPSLTMEHGGGERMKPGSWQYNLLKRWLEDGAPEPQRNDPTVTGLEVYPPKRLVRPGEAQQLLVRARWSDGRVEDVTRVAQYDTLNDALAQVDGEGLVRSLDRGEAYIMIRYCGQATVFQITAPYAELASYPDLPRNNFIDDHLIAKWRSLGLTPSELCSDEHFLRRVYLDTIGTLPTPAEVRAFLADPDPAKRAKVIDRLLERPEFVDFWALKWGDLLRNNRDYTQPKGMWAFHNWIRASLRDNKPVDEFAREIITAEGSTFTDGPANFYRIGPATPADWAETTSQVFLGVRIQCARCHHHPFEKWSQDDYYGMAAFFVRMGTKSSQEFGLFGRETVVHLKTTGEQTHPKKGGVVKPRPLDGEPTDDPFDRRRKLAEWLTAKDNPLFARNIVNRFWGYTMGRGLVEPLDDLRATNPATNPELLEALARDFAEHDYDLKHLLRTILNSRAYQLSAVVTPGNAADKENVFFARFGVRRLTAEQIADALDDATGTQEKYEGLPPGTRAIQLPDPNVRSYLLDVLGRPARQVVCECERTAVPNLAATLHLANSELVNAKIAKPGGRIDRLFQAKTPLPAVVEELYLVTVSRPPRPEELEAALRWINQAPNPRIGAEDLLWTLINSREFLFNH